MMRIEVLGKEIRAGQRNWRRNNECTDRHVPAAVLDRAVGGLAPDGVVWRSRRSPARNPNLLAVFGDERSMTRRLLGIGLGPRKCAAESFQIEERQLGISLMSTNGATIRPTLDHSDRCHPCLVLVHTIILEARMRAFQRMSTPSGETQEGSQSRPAGLSTGLSARVEIDVGPFFTLQVPADFVEAVRVVLVLVVQRFFPQPIVCQRLHLSSDRFRLLAHVLRHGRRGASGAAGRRQQERATRRCEGPAL